MDLTTSRAVQVATKPQRPNDRSTVAADSPTRPQTIADVAARAGVSVIMVEQNARRCLQICDRAYVLDQGKDAYTGTGRELMKDPKVIQLYLGTLADTA